MKNFGENVHFEPKRVYSPSSETEVLRLLDRHADSRIRVRGSLHAWSEAVATDDVLFDVAAFDQVRVRRSDEGEYWADVGAGCTLERLVRALDREGLALPTIGAVTKQTIAGAISTATHGSGNSSLSHFVHAVRVAAYDKADGSARILEFTEGDALRAARCAVGCMGVVLSVRLRVVPRYWVTETISHDATLEEVLARRAEWPLQQFMLIPYAWRFVAFNRRVADAPPHFMRRFVSRVYRYYDLLTLELLSHQMLAKVLLRFSPAGEPSGVLRAFYAHVAPRLIGGPRTIAPAMTALTLHSRQHASTRHVEMELFVREEQLDYATRLLKAFVEWGAGSDSKFPDELWANIQRCGLGDDLIALRGRYMHHYALIFRRVLADEALIAMTSDGDRYAIGVFTYLSEGERESYYEFCHVLARAFVGLLDARLHWGKFFPLTFEEIKPLYTGFDAFHAQCSLVDPGGAFVNEYAEAVLGFGR